MSRNARRLRYAAPVAVVVGGVACGVALTDGLGNTLATVLIAVGMIAFLALLLRDLGLSAGGTDGRSRRDDLRPHDDER